MTDEQVRLCRFLAIMIEDPGGELERIGAHPTLWGYRVRAGNAKPERKAGVFLEH